MGENVGAAALAVALALIGFLLIVAAARGTYRLAWSALVSGHADAGRAKTAPDTGASTGGDAGPSGILPDTGA